MHKVLVLDAEQRSALAIIRSLGRRRLTIIAGHHETVAIGASSRFTSESVRYPDPSASPRSFLRELTAIADRFAIDTIVPATDSTTMLLVSQLESLENVRLAAPSRASYELLTDKARLIELARALGIPIPNTRIATTKDEVADASREMGFPVVLKPARSKYLSGDRIVSTSVQVVAEAARLPDVLRHLEWLGDIPCLVQRFVPGYGAGMFGLYGPSGPIAWFAHRRIREKPPSGGVSVLSESKPIDPVMRSAAAKLLSAAAWAGAAMVEFRVSEDGTPYLMEVNGRFWGSLQLAIDCGIDFPWLQHRLIHGLTVECPDSYPIGRRLRWLMGDLDSLLIQLRRSGQSGTSRARAVAAFAGSFLDPSCRQEILRLSDPAPGLQEFVQWLRALR